MQNKWSLMVLLVISIFILGSILWLQDDFNNYKLFKQKHAELLLKTNQIAKLSNTAQLLTKKLLMPNDLPVIFDAIYQVVALCNGKQLSLSVKPQISHPFFIELPIHIEIHNSYNGVMCFLKAITRVNTLLTYGDLILELEQNTLALNVDLKFYQAN